MEEVEAYFSRQDLKGFFEELAKQIKSGKVIINVPGESQGKAKIVPKQPIDVIFNYDEDKGEMSIKIELEERRELEI